MRNLTFLAAVSTLLLAVLIGVLTMMPAPALPQVAGSDKLHHMLAFMALALPTAVLRPRWSPLVALILAIYGGLIELVQPYVDRSRDFADWQADLIGIALGTGLGLLLHLLLRQKLRLEN